VQLLIPRLQPLHLGTQGVGGVGSKGAEESVSSSIQPHDQAVSRLKDASGFVVLPRRWVVGSPLAWICTHAATRGTTNGSSSAETLISWRHHPHDQTPRPEGATPSWTRKPTQAS
jgi:hypothetical protein